MRNRAGLWLACAAGVAALIAVAYLGANMLGEEAADDSDLVALGTQVYAGQCAACHGENLEGQANWRSPLATGGFPAPPHDATGHTWHHADAVLFGITKNGGQADAPAGFKSNMPAFGETLSERELWAVLAYIKSTWSPRIRVRQQQINDRAG